MLGKDQASFYKELYGNPTGPEYEEEKDYDEFEESLEEAPLTVDRPASSTHKYYNSMDD
jgi:hypothetical protein